MARLDRIPVWPYSYWVILTIGIGFFFAFFDIVVIGLALPVLVQQFHVSLSLAVWTITANLIGYIVGAILDGVLSDFFGRRLALMLSMLFFSVASIISAFSPNIIFLIILRFFIGMGVGAEIDNSVTYIGELCCHGHRVSWRGNCTIYWVGIDSKFYLGLANIVSYWRNRRSDCACFSLVYPTIYSLVFECQ